MPVTDDTLRRHRKRIIDREEAAFRELMRAYEDVEREIRRQVRELQAKVKAATENGETISPTWYQQENRLNTLLDQVKNQIIRFGRKVAPAITRDAYIGGQVRAMAQKLCGGSLTPLLTHLIRTESLSAKDRSELRRLLEKPKKPTGPGEK